MFIKNVTTPEDLVNDYCDAYDKLRHADAHLVEALCGEMDSIKEELFRRFETLYGALSIVKKREMPLLVHEYGDWLSSYIWQRSDGKIYLFGSYTSSPDYIIDREIKPANVAEVAQLIAELQEALIGTQKS